jgi:UDP-N-acetyl-2-amino-2-deoxyglucuronate dehydrogenase
MAKSKIKFVIIGYGRIGKRHATVLQRLPNAQLIAICDTFAQQNTLVDSSISFFDSLETLLASNLLFDVAIIATPNGLHESQAVQLLEAGKHVVVEKPMALTKEGCEKIIHKALSKGKFVFCVMQNRYAHPSVWLKSIIDAGHLGRIFTVQVNCFWNRDTRYYHADSWHGTALDGGILYTQFAHFVDLIYWIFGDITDVKARFRNNNHNYLPETEDTGIVTFDFKRGGTGCLHYSTATFDKNFESSISILGEHGTVKLAGQYLDKIEYCHIQKVEKPNLPPAPTDVYAHHQMLLENVIEVLHGRKSITTNALEGLKVVEMIENIYKQKKVFNTFAY